LGRETDWGGRGLGEGDGLGETADALCHVWSAAAADDDDHCAQTDTHTDTQKRKQYICQIHSFHLADITIQREWDNKTVYALMVACEPA